MYGMDGYWVKRYITGRVEIPVESCTVIISGAVVYYVFLAECFRGNF